MSEKEMGLETEIQTAGWSCTSLKRAGLQSGSAP